MTSAANSRRRRDVKTQDREKSLSPLDKDHLKQRCLERVRSERRRLMARMRERRALGGDEFASGETAAVNQIEPGAASNHSSPLGYSLSSAREILHQGLNEIAGGNRRSRERRPYPEDEAAAAGSGLTGDKNPPRRVSRIFDPQRNTLPEFHEKLQGESHGESPGEPQSHLMAIEEETAYLNACSGGQCTGTPQRPAAAGGGRAGTSSSAAGHSPFTPVSRNFQGEYQHHAGVEGGQYNLDKGAVAGELQPTPVADGNDGWDDSSENSDEARFLSPEEYLEMMQYIEELCREEDLRAEAEVLQEYELTKKLEEEAVESAISSGIDFDEHGQDSAVLCPLCKRDYLLQAGPPSASIVCACGFRLDTAGDHLGLEHLRTQLAETYEHHSAECSAEPRFTVEGEQGLDVLWSSCDGCGFTRVVL